MFHLKLLFAGMLLASALPGTARAATDDLQAWTAASVTGALSGRATGTFEVGVRFDQDITRLNQIIVRPTLVYRIDDRFSIGGGYVYQQTAVDGGRDVHEHRAVQQLNWRIASGRGGTLSSRTRLEQRFVNTGNDVGHRLRAQLRYQRPLREKGPAFVVSAEPFFALNSTDWGARAGLDQLRGFVGINLPVAKRATLEAGYLHRYLNRIGRVDRDDHIVSTTLSIAL